MLLLVQHDVTFVKHNPIQPLAALHALHKLLKCRRKCTFGGHQHHVCSVRHARTGPLTTLQSQRFASSPHVSSQCDQRRDHHGHASLPHATPRGQHENQTLAATGAHDHHDPRIPSHHGADGISLDASKLTTTAHHLLQRRLNVDLPQCLSSLKPCRLGLLLKRFVNASTLSSTIFPTRLKPQKSMP